MGVSKVIYGNKVVIDLTADSIDPTALLVGYTAHGANGDLIEGACKFDADTSSATASVSQILYGQTAYARGVKLTGTMPNNGSINQTISTKTQVISIQQGYHDGSGVVSISPTEQAKLIAENIRENVTILGVIGKMSGSEGVKAESRTVTPSSSVQTIIPNADEGYNYLSQVVVNAIPYSEQSNSAGGTTVTIG